MGLTLNQRFKTNIAALSADAKLTQARYGTSNSPAVRSSRQKATIVAVIDSQRKAITTRPASGDCPQKNAHDQLALKTSCTRKIAMAAPLPGVLGSSLKTRQNA